MNSYWIEFPDTNDIILIDEDDYMRFSKNLNKIEFIRHIDMLLEVVEFNYKSLVELIQIERHLEEPLPETKVFEAVFSNYIISFKRFLDLSKKMISNVNKEYENMFIDIYQKKHTSTEAYRLIDEIRNHISHSATMIKSVSKSIKEKSYKNSKEEVNFERVYNLNIYVSKNNILKDLSKKRRKTHFEFLEVLEDKIEIIPFITESFKVLHEIRDEFIERLLQKEEFEKCLISIKNILEYYNITEQKLFLVKLEGQLINYFDISVSEIKEEFNTKIFEYL